MLYNINYETLKEMYEKKKLEKQKRIFSTKDKNGDIYKVIPSNIESVICMNEGISSCVVVKKKDDIKSYVPVAYITLKPGHSVTITLINTIELCKEKLKPYEIPVDVQLLDKIPMKKNDEVDYAYLEDIANGVYYNKVLKHKK